MALAMPLSHEVKQPPILLSPDREVKKAPPSQAPPKRFLLGSITMAFAMIPVARGLPIPVYGYIFDMFAGGLAEMLVVRYNCGAAGGGIIFGLFFLASFACKYLLQWTPDSFSSPLFWYVIEGILLAFLLGINFGLLTKKSKDEEQPG
jgi:hypothetical protein